ncbi:hypothetical protein AAJ72_14750 [Citromicrobium sp. RCC1885]|nr:hypothetical protein AAJ72_14750 [Citromicrobium sp. RCC1885]KPM23474.1 hypothetical protein AAJ74_15410 [Citromicrobium sp. RCC1878]OAM06991.1 hypothetical protein A0U43_13845 [Citromicrobium sp. RCC1897]
MDIAKAVQHLTQIARTAVDVLGRIMPVENAKLAGGRRHELCKSGSTSWADRHRIEAGLGPNQCLHQSRRKPIPNLSLPDQRLVKCFAIGCREQYPRLRFVAGPEILITSGFRLFIVMFQQRELLCLCAWGNDADARYYPDHRRNSHRSHSCRLQRIRIEHK